MSGVDFPVLIKLEQSQKGEQHSRPEQRESGGDSHGVRGACFPNLRPEVGRRERAHGGLVAPSTGCSWPVCVSLWSADTLSPFRLSPWSSSLSNITVILDFVHFLLLL